MNFLCSSAAAACPFILYYRLFIIIIYYNILYLFFCCFKLFLNFYDTFRSQGLSGFVRPHLVFFHHRPLE